MSHFYGTVEGHRSQATRQGTQSSGMETYCASWEGAIRSYAYAVEYCSVCGQKVRKDTLSCGCKKLLKKNITTKDHVRVEKVTWHGRGESKVLYDGLIGKSEPKQRPFDMTFWKLVAKYEDSNAEYSFDDYMSLFRDDIDDDRRFRKVIDRLKWMISIFENAEHRRYNNVNTDRWEELKEQFTREARQ